MLTWLHRLQTRCYACNILIPSLFQLIGSSRGSLNSKIRQNLVRWVSDRTLLYTLLMKNSTDLNPSWHTSNSFLSVGNWFLTDCTKSGLSLVNGNPKNNPTKLLCTVLFITVPENVRQLGQMHLSFHSIRWQKLNRNYSWGGTEVIVLVLNEERDVITLLSMCSFILSPVPNVENWVSLDCYEIFCFFSVHIVDLCPDLQASPLEQFPRHIHSTSVQDQPRRPRVAEKTTPDSMFVDYNV